MKNTFNKSLIVDSIKKITDMNYKIVLGKNYYSVKEVFQSKSTDEFIEKERVGCFSSNLFGEGNLRITAIDLERHAGQLTPNQLNK